MRFLSNLFKKKIATCHICNAPIYKGEYYGSEIESTELSITGSFEYFFCRYCVQTRALSGEMNEKQIGKKYIITDRNGRRFRITIRLEK
jgi:hypothetical protein